MFNANIHYRTTTPVAGAVTFNTNHIAGEILSIHIKPTTSTTTYKVSLVGKNGLIIWRSEQDGVGETGEISQTIMNRVIDEICTVELTASSRDELWVV